jgi:hypothetical protein
MAALHQESQTDPTPGAAPGVFFSCAEATRNGSPLGLSCVGSARGPSAERKVAFAFSSQALRPLGAHRFYVLLAGDFRTGIAEDRKASGAEARVYLTLTADINVCSTP